MALMAASRIALEDMYNNECKNLGNKLSELVDYMSKKIPKDTYENLFSIGGVARREHDPIIVSQGYALTNGGLKEVKNYKIGKEKPMLEFEDVDAKSLAADPIIFESVCLGLQDIIEKYEMKIPRKIWDLHDEKK